MIHRLEIENFYSIRDLQIIDLIASKAEKGDQNRLTPIGPGSASRAPSVVAFFGANASGKSNILKAIPFLAWFITGSFSLGPNKFLPFHRFADPIKSNSRTRLAVRLCGPTDPEKIGEADEQSCEYEYELEIAGEANKPQHIFSEGLRYWPLKTKRPVQLFFRDENGKVKAHKSFGLSGFNLALENVLRNNASVVSTLAQLNHPVAIRITNSVMSTFSNIFIMREEATDENISDHYINDPELTADLNRQIESIDLGINKIEFYVGANGPTAQAHHNNLNQVIPLLFESHGTKQFVKVFPIIRNALIHGGLAVVDELDLAIHPYILPEILKLFHDPKLNRYSAQLWISAHSASLLEELIKDEIYFCKKDMNGATDVYGLKDVQAVKRTDNFYKKYLSGVYGGVPLLG